MTATIEKIRKYDYTDVMFWSGILMMIMWLIAKILSISQPALSQRLKTGGYWAVQAFLERFKVIIQNKVGVL